MSLIIRDTDHVPPEGFWIYPVAETHFSVKTKYFPRLYAEIVTHCRSNNVAEPSEQSVIDYICKNQRVPCYESESRQPLINLFTQSIPKPPPIGCCGGGQRAA